MILISIPFSTKFNSVHWPGSGRQHSIRGLTEFRLTFAPNGTEKNLTGPTPVHILSHHARNSSQCECQVGHIGIVQRESDTLITTDTNCLTWTNLPLRVSSTPQNLSSCQILDMQVTRLSGGTCIPCQKNSKHVGILKPLFRCKRLMQHKAMTLYEQMIVCYTCSLTWLCI